MKFERVTDAKHPMYERALELYGISFPLHEQREPLSQEKILCDREYFFSLIYDEEVFVGLVLYWETESYVYIEHFCISPPLRSKRYGERVLSALKEKNKTLILEIDPPRDPISRRRKFFYERCQFSENLYFHIHPPYHKENEGHELVLMTYPKPIPQEVYDAFREYLGDRIMGERAL